jgi:hypothetical protein
MMELGLTRAPVAVRLPVFQLSIIG